MGRVLQQIETWAGAECAVVYDRLPKFDGHNLGAIEDAPDEFIRIGGKLALKETVIPATSAARSPAAHRA